jgi:5-(carboxyamino)imidazole ribonucleotide synthase
MLGLAGQPLGFSFTFLDPAAECPATVAGHVLCAPFDDAAALHELAARSDVVTWEFENVPEASAQLLSDRVLVRPPVMALAESQDRLREKDFFSRLGIATAGYEAVEGGSTARAALERIGLPALLKTRRLGYDGRGQRVLCARHEIAPALAQLGDVPLLVEAFVPFERELSIVSMRSRDGACAFYPLVENRHVDGILRLSLAPAPGLTHELQARAEAIARRVLDGLEYVGVLAIELFQAGDDLLANEMAPRVHNSGHWTIEGAETSQFENHLRAIAGLPLGSPRPRGHSAMVNLIGTLPDTRPLLRVPGLHLHLYGKAPRPGRKLGHVTLIADEPATLGRRLESLREVLGEAFTVPGLSSRAPG